MLGKLIYGGPSDVVFSVPLIDGTVRIGRAPSCQICAMIGLDATSKMARAGAMVVSRFCAAASIPDLVIKTLG